MRLGLALEMELIPALRLATEQVQICRVCRKDLGAELHHDLPLVDVARAINGTCPCCGQSAPATPDRNYRARARRWEARLRRERRL